MKGYLVQRGRIWRKIHCNFFLRLILYYCNFTYNSILFVKSIQRKKKISTIPSEIKPSPMHRTTFPGPWQRYPTMSPILSNFSWGSLQRNLQTTVMFVVCRYIVRKKCPVISFCSFPLYNSIIVVLEPHFRESDV